MFNPKSYLESKLLKAGTYILSPVEYRYQTKTDGSTGLMVEFAVEGQDVRVPSFWFPENDLAIRMAASLARLVDPRLLEKSYPTALEFFEEVVKAAEGKRIVALVAVNKRPDGSLVNRIKSFIRLENGAFEAKKEKQYDEVPF